MVRQKSFTPYATFTDRPQTDRQTDRPQTIKGPGLGPTRLPRVSQGTVGLPPCRALRGTSECYASGVGPTVTRYTLGESSRTQPWPWPLNLCQIVPHHVMLCWSDSGPSCRASRFIYTLKPITEVKQRRVWLVLGWVTPLEHKCTLTIHAEVGRVVGGGSQFGVEGGGSRKWLEGYTNIAHIDQFWTKFFCFSKKNVAG